jgi:large subunit ribosomal protein L35Ae
MEGIIVNYRRGRKTQKTNQMIILVPGYDKEKAQKLVGKEVVYTTEGKQKKQIKGKITSVHGNKGAVRALFERGMPGQAIGQKIEVKE